MGEQVTFSTKGATTPGYLARPPKPGPGVIVIQGWGLVPQVERVADRFASEGFVALAPDLDHGKTTKSPDEAGKLMMSLRVDDAARDLAVAIDYLTAPPELTGRTFRTFGFCTGGALSRRELR